jgi:hypothetical protein
MAKRLPDHHSPLMALGKKVLLWVIVPAALVLTAIYVVDTELPARQEVKRVAQENTKKRVEELSHVNARAEKLKASLATPTTVEVLQRTFQLLGEELKGDELERVRNMSDSERAEFKQKKIDGLSLSEKNAYARKLNEWAQKRLDAQGPAATAPEATACGLTTFQVPGKNAEFVATRTGLKGPYTDLKIVLKSGMTVPKGSVVIDPYGKVVAECRAETCTEFKLDITGESMVPGILDVKLSPNKAAAEAYVYPSINGVNEITCLRGQTPKVAH